MAGDPDFKICHTRSDAASIQTAPLSGVVLPSLNVHGWRSSIKGSDTQSLMHSNALSKIPLGTLIGAHFGLVQLQGVIRMFSQVYVPQGTHYTPPLPPVDCSD